MAAELWQRFLAGQPPRDVLIIDAHTHMGSLAEFPVHGGGSAEQMLAEMNRLGFRAAVSAPFAAWAGELEEGHDRRPCCGRSPGSLLRLLRLQPRLRRGALDG